jgi:RNA polymerase sigma-70 factor (sigma-E family)
MAPTGPEIERNRSWGPLVVGGVEGAFVSAAGGIEGVGPLVAAARRRRPGRTTATTSVAAELDASFEAVFAEEHEPMVRLAFLLVGDEDDAEELVQEAFVALHEHWDRVDRPGAYLRQCVVNRSRDLLRRRAVARRLRWPTRDDAELGADHLLDALAALPVRRRAAVVLRYYEGRSEAEIARMLGVRPGTVKSLLHRALAQLREAIEP